MVYGVARRFCVRPERPTRFKGLRFKSSSLAEQRAFCWGVRGGEGFEGLEVGQGLVKQVYYDLMA